MKNQPTASKADALPRFPQPIGIARLLPTLVLLLSIHSSHAGSATWQASPGTGDWNTAGNWTAGGPPNGSADTATFASSSITGISVSLDTEVNGIVFNAGASAYSITAPGRLLALGGVGITNNSGIMQNFVASGTSDGLGNLQFFDGATVGYSTSFTMKELGFLNFYGTSSAKQGHFLLEGGATSGGVGAGVSFWDYATADRGNFTLNGGTASGASGAYFQYFSAAETALNGNFIVAGGAADAASGASVDIYPSAATKINGNFTINGGTAANTLGPYVYLLGVATEVNGRITVNGGTAAGASGPIVYFNPGSATNGVGSFVIHGGAVSGAFGGYMECDYFDAGNGTYTVSGGRGRGATGGALYFSYTPGVNGTLIAKGGTSHGDGGMIYINSSSSGGTPRVKVLGNGGFDVSGWSSGANAVASIEGRGLIFLGGYELSVGNNNTSTIFSGVLKDGGLSGGSLGSLTKVGAGTLTLSGANTYTGGTTVSGGTLLVTNKTGSATGTGTVLMKSGALGGTGQISGAVTVASGRTAAILAPGSGARSGTLVMSSALTFNAPATYQIDLNSGTVTADQVAAFGVNINSAALVSIDDRGTGTLTTGTVFTVINNTAATPIAGTFSNLADGSIFTVGNNNFKANYEGGTGNDLTLTVQ